MLITLVANTRRPRIANNSSKAKFHIIVADWESMRREVDPQQILPIQKLWRLNDVLVSAYWFGLVAETNAIYSHPLHLCWNRAFGGVSDAHRCGVRFIGFLAVAA